MHIFCSGIGGIGLSAYSALLRCDGHSVSGSDRAESPLLDDLRSQGITVTTTQDGSTIPSDCDLYVFSEALSPDHPERKAASARGIRSLSYFAALGELSRPYDVLAICGTHGKSSTTAMLSLILIDAGMDPTVVVGTKLPHLQGRNWRKGKSKIFVLEACEYRRSFHYLSPDTVVMTTVDGDHFDYYKDIEDYHRAFAEFLSLLPPDGRVIYHGSDPSASPLALHSRRLTIDADQYPAPSVGVSGIHMRENARLAYAAARSLGIPHDRILRSLAAYRGAWRRMEHVGTTLHGIPVIDDYAHHPLEIRATLQAARERYPDHRIVCVFQPHTHDRTMKLYDAFTHAFTDADLIIVPGIYEARADRDAAKVHVEDFVKDLEKGSSVPCLWGQSLAETQQRLRSEILRVGDVLLVMGAGDVTNLAHAICTP